MNINNQLNELFLNKKKIILMQIKKFILLITIKKKI